jgi:hypothetical protein
MTISARIVKLLLVGLPPEKSVAYDIVKSMEGNWVSGSPIRK